VKVKKPPLLNSVSDGGVVLNRELESENFMIKKYFYARLIPYLIHKVQ